MEIGIRILQRLLCLCSLEDGYPKLLLEPSTEEAPPRHWLLGRRRQVQDQYLSGARWCPCLAGPGGP